MSSSKEAPPAFQFVQTFLKMNAADDDDLKLQRASTALLSDLQTLLPKLSPKRKHDGSSGQIHQRVREIDVQRIFTIVEPFQEDPQILDAHLKTFLPQLVVAYLETLRTSSRAKPKKHFVPLSHAICRILNLFCKVRGEKVIKGFLNNEPRYLEPILHEFEEGDNFPKEGEDPISQSIVPWEERYVLLLWLSHLSLAPFPLASMSALQSSQETAAALALELPPEAPGVTLRILTICIKGLQSATKERSAAANLLVRLSVRPDMQKLGLLSALVKWSLSFFSTTSETLSDIHQSLGVLTFLSGLVAAATNEEIGPFLSDIYQSCQNIIKQDNLLFVKSSAVARKLVVKTLRVIVVHILQATVPPPGLDGINDIAEVIEYLLETVGDGDTPVRYAASKALSIITMKLDTEMAGEVVDAILGELNENVYWQGQKRNLSGVSPLKWHGLTLTLSHLLYRRALSPAQLPEILNALLLAHAFEQRSATGGSQGTNVRDAACFGIWALSRRYSTKDLLAVDTSSIRAARHRHESFSIPQVLAIQLLVVACLDPSGNIRRGSSAALQELIGRHPNTVVEGIPMVQIVDFHAVGLRDRAICDVAIKAAQLHHMYWEAIFENMLEWSGTGSLDAPSRLSAASAIGLLSKGQSSSAVYDMVDQISAKLGALRPREVEERHGLVMALFALVTEVDCHNRIGVASEYDLNDTPSHIYLTNLWSLFGTSLKLEDKAFMSPTLRPEFTASAICNFLGVLATMTLHEAKQSRLSSIPIEEIVRLFNLCLGRYEESVLQAIPASARGVFELMSATSPSTAKETISNWLSQLESESSHNGRRYSGFAIALGAIYSLLGEVNVDVLSVTDEQDRIVKVLTFRCTASVDIQARTVALRALEVLLKNIPQNHSSVLMRRETKQHIADALHTALNDYTVTERGDVGSLVRLEALNTTGTAWSTGLLDGSSLEERLHADVLRLSLEKLDKIRARAAHVLEQGNLEHFEKVIQGVAEGVSSYLYFSTALQILLPSTSYTIKEAVLLGFVSSAGMASESVVQNSRAALLDALDISPTSTEDRASRTDEFSLVEVANCLVDLMKQSLETERVLIPLLEVVAFLFDMQIMHRLVPTPFNFRALLSVTQRAHFKSSHMQKLHLALDVYRGLGMIESTRKETIAKVTSMLLHPFPNIRVTAAETLWVLTQDESLKMQDWGQSPKALKEVVDGIKSAVL
ncbi:tubulin folding cofactor D C terminal-domain-containing protein [Clohesyomyces aquaticus]|uniref:Tubulin folding cofactor D C terminal-domain-containing protein n=1 Tax=Clohesyomyces aquaticus TaxID=1231657 RepID=A0A1Y1ZIJ3_9PLEO|nr:tubulin folding cofactor D C terminal-domain-containing protein [Clohesyomyces aquaticus]